MTKLYLTGKRILYLGPVFFSYDQILIKKLKALGCEVVPFEIEITGFRFKFVNKFFPSKIDEFKEHYYNRALTKDYDYILIRQGHQLTDCFLEKLRLLNPKAKFINFHWDSIKENYNYQSKLRWFDNVYSFDYNDCDNHPKIQYLPLFFIDEYFTHESNNAPIIKYDILFIGAWRNKERYQLIQLTKKLCRQQNLRFYYYLYLSLRRQYWLLKAGKRPKKAKSRHLSHIQILKLFSTSDTIIDFPSSFQSGLTMRTFETLAAGKKLITTNRNIKKEPFYNPEYIDIVDPNNLHFDINFIKHSPTTSIKEVMKPYSIENYIYKLLK